MGDRVYAFGRCGPGQLDAAYLRLSDRTWVPLPRTLAGVLQAVSWRGRPVVVDFDGRLRTYDGHRWTALPDLTVEPGFAELGVAVVDGDLEAVTFRSDSGEDRDHGVVSRLSSSGWQVVATNDDPPDKDPSPVVVDGALAYRPLGGGLCTVTGSATSCLDNPAADAVSRFELTSVVAPDNRIYLWGGQAIPDGDGTSADSDTGVVVTLPPGGRSG